MKNLLLILCTLLAINTSCSSDVDTPQEIDCLGLSIEVTNFTTNYSAYVQISGGTSPYTKQWSNGETTGTIGGTDGILEVGTYTVTVTDAKGCIQSGSIIITHQPATVENSVECISSDNAIINVAVTYNGESEIVEKGVYFSTTTNPTINDTTVVFSNINANNISLEMLSLDTTYYVRGYAINSAGINYAEEVSFTTKKAHPTLSIGQVHEGGIIVSLTCDGLHGYVVKGDWDYEGTWNTANETCENLVYNGYDDWYLPRITQVQQIQKNLFTNGIGDFNTGSTIYDNYWGAPKHYNTDYTCNYSAFYWDFDANTGDALSICYHLKFRPVRDF